ncbi:hypothetical protein CEUSTIGMA_g6574.t1 [Chlamydomonas eustigma]|uniref:PDEase domain-containing protein n=1 Tax=Chlamydomonas eustigma TaxID=1157962 RepID=A0A250X7S1_9CHLO|nr:hypothetical protein CEUSTIGMA_g6574.t1 [Chlamydomonas eustigma]|eukprot:GAX79134.1 hypothetical protein CEUSTIGMA_g6574.t1 [Chlamydomonas eustigma]
MIKENLPVSMQEHGIVADVDTSGISRSGGSGIMMENQKMDVSVSETKHIPDRSHRLLGGASGGRAAAAAVASSSIKSFNMLKMASKRFTRSFAVTPTVIVEPSYQPKDDGEKLLCLQVALKVADIGSILRPKHVAIKSIDGLEEESFRQGDKERELGLPVTPLFDRDKHGVSRAQKGFIDFIAMPLLRSFVRIFPETDPLLQQLKNNYVELLALSEQPSAIVVSDLPADEVISASLDAP